MKRINLFFAAVTAGMMALGHAGSAKAVIGKVNFVYNMPAYGYGYIMVQYPMAGSWAWSNKLLQSAIIILLTKMFSLRRLLTLQIMLLFRFTAIRRAIVQKARQQEILIMPEMCFISLA